MNKDELLELLRVCGADPRSIDAVELAYEMGRTLIGYEVQKVLAAVDWLQTDPATDGAGKPLAVAMIGHGEGGRVGFYAAALDDRIGVYCMSGAFGPQEGIAYQPIYRNVWGQLTEFGDAEVLGVLQKMIKQRQESVELYEKGGRAELADQERAEIAVIQGYLPQQMSDDDVKAAIAATITETGAAGIKDMGKVIGALKAKYAGQMDFSKASGLVKAALTG